MAVLNTMPVSGAPVISATSIVVALPEPAALDSSPFPCLFRRLRREAERGHGVFDTSGVTKRR